jgi:UDP-2,3-diacylglucosamine hydrolase
LGDILDVLVGPFEFWKQSYSELFSELETWIGAGKKVLWIEGNHDFFIRKLLEPLGIEVIDGEIERRYGEQRVYLAHGDLVNARDTDYLKWRAFTRNESKRRIFALLPDWPARSLFLRWAQSKSRESRNRNRDKTPTAELKGLYRAFARKKFEQGYAGVFLGHCHIADEHRVGDAFYVNLGSALDGSLRYALWDIGFQSFPKTLFYRKMKE